MKNKIDEGKGISNAKGTCRLLIHGMAESESGDRGQGGYMMQTNKRIGV
jgi:hypothetical protein